MDDNQEIAAQYDVRGIPCIIVFKDGSELDRIIGAYPEAEGRKKIDMILAKAERELLDSGKNRKI
ncbi:thioredoxin family protein [Candidatus Woesearchaeota archaeon]|nr:thioredoxin family protein [Candidatus Woesearchaeota archaeon]